MAVKAYGFVLQDSRNERNHTIKSRKGDPACVLDCIDIRVFGSSGEVSHIAENNEWESVGNVFFETFTDGIVLV